MQYLHIAIDHNVQILHTICAEDVHMTELKDKRIARHLTQKEVANRIGISLRSYVSYENDESKCSTAKYKYLLREVDEMNRIDESHGILSKEDITKICNDIFNDYNVKYCYLFGSYAKGSATELSDVDLLISTETTGLKYYELLERLREGLCKNVDLLDLKQLLKNEELADEILKEGIRIYG